MAMRRQVPLDRTHRWRTRSSVAHRCVGRHTRLPPLQLNAQPSKGMRSFRLRPSSEALP